MNSPFPISLLPSWWKSVGLLVAGGLLACIVWTLPNWSQFWTNVSQFPALWQIPTNRIAILTLTIKIISPLFIMLLIGILLWISALIKPSATDLMIAGAAQEQSPSSQPSPDLDSFPSKYQQTDRETFSPIQMPASVSTRHDPMTPIPPTLLTPEPLTQLPEQAAIAEISPVREDSRRPEIVQHDEGEKQNAPLAGMPSGVPAFSQEQTAAPHPLISIHILKDVRVALNLPDGDQVQVPLTFNARRIQLLAYIAWRQGEMIDRDKMLEQVFGWGFSDEEATEDKLTVRFESHKKLLRKRIREVVIEQVNTPAGREVIDPDIDPFVSTSGFWALSDICRVDDLATITTCAKTIAAARTNGKLIDHIPEDVKDACEQIVATYTGDFLESLIKKFPGDFRAWQGRGSWVRKPFTLYRDYYLEALWLLGQYTADKQATEEDQSKALEWCVKAAQFYQTYAMHACNSRYDTKVTFGTHGEYGERVGMSERAIRRCIVLLGSTGKTDLVSQVWSAYSSHMKAISDQRWQPGKETLDDVRAAEAQTGAYRLATQVAPGSDEVVKCQE